MSTKTSFAKAARKIEKARIELGKAPASGLRIIGEEIKTDVSASRPGKGVPRDEGTLAASITVTGPVDNRVQISAGDASAPYALVQHERLDFRHELGEARYLVRGLERWEADGSAGIRALRENHEAALRRAARG